MQSWYHGGVLLKWHHSTLVGVASLADVMVQVIIYTVEVMAILIVQC